MPTETGNVQLIALKAAARRGRRLIEAGDSFREDITDVEFSELVVPEDEDEVIETMIDSGQWDRMATGFNWRGGFND